MKVLLLCGGAANQKALAHKISHLLQLDSIILFDASLGNTSVGRFRSGQIRQQLSSITIGYPLRAAWYGMLRHYDALYPDFPISPALNCADVNTPSVHEYVARVKPDLVLVSGTNLLRDPLIDEIQRHGRVMNLHTGISPYVKGGPDCTYWCLALREFGLIGNTVMWLDVGIDRGNIIATERTVLAGDETLLKVRIAVMEHAHALYLKCIERYVSGDRLPDVPQASFPIKRLFLGKHWRGWQMASAVFNYYVHFHRGSPFLDEPRELTLVNLAD